MQTRTEHHTDTVKCVEDSHTRTDKLDHFAGSEGSRVGVLFEGQSSWNKAVCMRPAGLVYHHVHNKMSETDVLHMAQKWSRSTC